MTDFRLRKWYMDVTTADRAFIGYAATIEWKKITLQYNGSLLADASGVVQKNSFRKTAFPVFENEILSWQCAGISGEWKTAAAPVEELLLENADGKILWRCVQPKAHAVVQLKNAPPLEGHGYTEFIELTLPPWKLPIRELRWGRFTGETDAVTWIEWRGEIPRTLVFHNGKRYTDATITDDAVHFGTFRLQAENLRPLRSGAVQSTVFRSFAWVKKLFPHPVFRTEESKWFSDGLLSENGNPPARGKLIHETVLWR